MPPKAKKPRQPKGSKKGTKGQIVGLTSVAGLFPPLFHGTMFYETQLIVQPVAATMSYNTFRANSVFDPDLTNAGTTVAGYTQAAAVYGRYRVLSIKGTVSFLNRGADGAHAFIVATPANTIGTNFNSAMAQRHVWQSPLAAVTGAGAIKHTFSFPIHKVYGVPRSQVRNEDDFAGLTSSHPNNIVYLHVGAFNPSSGAGAVNFTIRLEYEVVWSLPLAMPY